MVGESQSQTIQWQDHKNSRRWYIHIGCMRGKVQPLFLPPSFLPFSLPLLSSLSLLPPSLPSPPLSPLSLPSSLLSPHTHCSPALGYSFGIGMRGWLQLLLSYDETVSAALEPAGTHTLTHIPSEAMYQ